MNSDKPSHLKPFNEAFNRKYYFEENRDGAYFIKHIAETSPDILFIFHMDTLELKYTNRHVAGDLGYSDEDIANMMNPLFDIMHEDDKPLMLAHFSELRHISDGEVREIEYRLLNKDGTVSWYSDRNSIFKRDRNGRPIEKIGISQNISLRKFAEIKLISNLNLLQQAELISKMGTWVYVVLTGEYTWSEGMYRLFGIQGFTEVRPEIYFDYTPEEQKPLVASFVNKIQNDFQGFEETITILANDNINSNDSEVVNLIPRKRKRIVKIKAEVIRDVNGKPLSVIGIDLDITEHVRNSEKINLLDNALVLRNEELSFLNSELKTFNNIAANDYQDTLKNLYTCMEFIITNDAKNLSNSGKANIRRAQTAIQKMKLLTNDIVNYSRLESFNTELSLVDLSEIINTEINLLKTKFSDLNIKCDTEELPVIQGYPMLQSLLFHHLLINCIKFHKEEPIHIRISYSKKKGREIRHELAIPGTDYAIIGISDNGIGFDNEHKDSIFDMFYRLNDRSKYKGSGVGLAICKKVMHLHKGFITADGQQNGSTFCCYFPMNFEK